MAASDRAVAAVTRAGTAFHKLSGSGNDFVAFDLMRPHGDLGLPTAEAVRALCRRGTGVGADGVMVIRPAEGAHYQLVYYNADGTRAELCGNASLCSVRLAVELGYAPAHELAFLTDSGRIAGRISDGLPEIDLAPATELQPGRDELLTADDAARGLARAGFARVGVPHVVIRCADAARADVAGRGPVLRRHPSLADGANVNFVSRRGDAWSIRTYERGVEAETLACGTGSVATTLLLAAWRELSAEGASSAGGGAAVEQVAELVTASGLSHRVTLRRSTPGQPWRPSLAGSARMVFHGMLGEGDW